MRTSRGSTFAWIAVTLCAAVAGYEWGRSVPARAAGNAEVLLEADRAFERDTRARAAEGWVDWFAEDGRMFPDGRNVIQGKAAIRELMGPFFSRAGSSLRWEPVAGDIAESGDLGYTFGHSISVQRDDKGEMTERYGKYVTIWKKQADGSWKVALDIGNSRPKP